MSPTIQPETSTPQAPAVDLQLAALLGGSALSPLLDTGWIRITGDDRVRWLNGMVTNSIQELQPGQGNYSFLLNAQGRIQGDAHVFAEPAEFEALLLETSLSQVPNLITLLDHFIIMDDVELTDVSATRSGLLVAGPQAPALLDSLLLPASDLPPLQLKTILWRTSEVTILHAHSPLVPRFELWADAATISVLTSALQEAGATSVTQTALEDLRVLEGTPRYGTDIRDRDLPQETVQTRALHFAKGCYLGQEIVERIRSRGNVHRTFTAFRLEGALPAAGTLLEAEGKQIGELTSVCAISLSNQHLQLALGYTRREALDRNLPLTYPGGIAIPVPAPFHIPTAG
ncbi:folate-binding protein [Granulicella sp. dw_53]|uniref:CAF17-like 4Fe-4S cluster assembly/insertion protein YgfZ n=1 Tax=Granulicella sp. dw_53 TaxID=2719792 RepID=UPI001BD69475|nr:folate-binding protein [Granulicella sp. dw_53]